MSNMFRPWEDKPAKPATVLDKMATNPVFKELRATLQADLNEASSTIFDSLHDFSTATHLDKQESQLVDNFIRCMNFDPVRVNMLYKFYCQQSQSIKLEKRRGTVPGSPFASSTEKFYDHQRQQLIDRVQKSLSLIEDSGKAQQQLRRHPKFNTSKDSSGYSSFASSHESSCDNLESTRLDDSDQPLDLTVSTTSSHTPTPQLYSPYERSSSIEKKSLNPEAIHVLTSWYRAHHYHPYPTPEDIEYLADQGNVTPTQVRKWFSNKRFRSRDGKSTPKMHHQQLFYVPQFGHFY